ncbi:MAG: DUF6498-containing protein [Alphaproteobacteria bacterium]
MSANPLLLAGVILGNIAPVFGVIFFEWSLFDIFYLYWAENVLIGFMVIVRMLVVGAASGIAMLFGSINFVIFFCFHYGLFCMVHGTILFDLFGNDVQLAKSVSKHPELLIAFAFNGAQDGFLIALSGIALIVVIEGLKAMREDKAEARLPVAVMFRPYGRILVLHTAILLGGFAAQSLGEPVSALIFLIVLKIIYDIICMQEKRLAEAGNPDSEPEADKRVNNDKADKADKHS